MFKRFDKNRDGQVSTTELVRAVERLALNGAPLDRTSKIKLLRSADISRDGFVDYKEFVAWVLGKERVDKDGDGKLSHHEAATAVAAHAAAEQNRAKAAREGGEQHESSVPIGNYNDGLQERGREGRSSDSDLCQSGGGEEEAVNRPRSVLRPAKLGSRIASTTVDQIKQRMTQVQTAHTEVGELRARRMAKVKRQQRRSHALERAGTFESFVRVRDCVGF
jgi:hypothetical protein